MPVTIIADGFFRPTTPQAAQRAVQGVDATSVHDVAFKTCAAAAAVQASWATVSKSPVSTGADGEAAVSDAQERWTVVCVGDPDAVMDNDRMAALRSGVSDLFSEPVFIVSSPGEGDIRLHESLTGDALLHAAAVASVVQAALVWDKSDPIVVTCGHRAVACRPTFGEVHRNWNVTAQLQ